MSNNTKSQNSPRQLRVLVSAFACSPGGGPASLGGGELILGWNVVHQLARFHKVVAFTHTDLRPSIESSLNGNSNGKLEFYYLGLPRWLEALKDYGGGIQFYAYLWQIKAFLVARRLHKQRPFDVFHHVTYANDWMASFIGALLPIPYIRGPGGGAQRTPKAFLREYKFLDRVWERIRCGGQWTLRRDPFFILGQRRALALLVCNHEALEALPAKWKKKALHFPVNGVTSEDFATASLALRKAGIFRVFSAGKLLHWKGFGLVIKSFSRFAEKHPEAELAIAGEGPEFPRLKALVHDLGVEDKVRFERWLTRQEVISRMRASDVFLYGSLREGGGAIVVEAMAAGIPVVCLDLSGPSIHVGDDCGIKVSPESPSQVVREMAEALERLYSGPEIRRRMGKAARNRAEEVYHWDREGELLLKIYQRALDLCVEHNPTEPTKDENIVAEKTQFTNRHEP